MKGVASAGLVLVNLDIERMPIVPHEVAVHDAVGHSSLHQRLNPSVPVTNEALAWAAANRSCPPSALYVAVVYDEQVPPSVAEFRSGCGIYRMPLPG